MNMQRRFRTGLLLCCVISMLLTTAIPVRAEQIEAAVEEQTAETKLQEEQVIQLEDVTGLDAEFEALEEESVLIVEEVEQYRKDAERKKILRIIVIVLVIVVFGVGIVTGLREKKKKDSMAADNAENKTEQKRGGQE